VIVGSRMMRRLPETVKASPHRPAERETFLRAPVKYRKKTTTVRLTDFAKRKGP
jgi:hypothetical protein